MNRKSVATYRYVDEQSRLLFEVVRFEPKGFAQRRRSDDGWVWNLEGTRRVLFQLPEVISSQCILIVEGEKDVESLAKYGTALTGTTCPAGAGKWRDEYSVCLSGKEVWVLPDSDDAGRRHALDVLSSVLPHASELNLIELPNGLKDFSEWAERNPPGDGEYNARLINDLLATAQPIKSGPDVESLCQRWDLNNRARLSRHTHPADQSQPFRGHLNAPTTGDINTSVTRRYAVDPPLPAPDLLPFAMSDSGNAERLLATYPDVHFCPETKEWLIWDGVIWRPDCERKIEHLMKNTARALFYQSSNSPGERDVLARFALKSESDHGIRAAVSRASTEPRVIVHLEALDRNPFLVGVANGTLRLDESQTFGPPIQSDLLTRQLPVIYDPDATCPRWCRFLEEVFAGEAELIAFIQRAAGYFMTGSVKEECLFLLHGSGRNGKGVFLGTLQALLGESYAGTIDFRALQASQRDSGPRDDIASIRGKRLVISQESGEGAAFDESLIKWLTGGDRVRARMLYANAIEFRPTWKLAIATNHRPRIQGTDPAIWSRIRLIPFRVSFEGREDRGLKDALHAELPGILNWCIEGARQWLAGGLNPPPVVLETTNEYRVDEDVIARFLEDRCEVDPVFSAPVAQVYAEYLKWCEENGERQMSKRMLGDKLAARGMARSRSEDSRKFCGLRVRGELPMTDLTRVP